MKARWADTTKLEMGATLSNEREIFIMQPDEGRDDDDDDNRMTTDELGRQTDVLKTLVQQLCDIHCELEKLRGQLATTTTESMRMRQRILELLEQKKTLTDGVQEMVPESSDTQFLVNAVCQSMQNVSNDTNDENVSDVKVCKITSQIYIIHMLLNVLKDRQDAISQLCANETVKNFGENLRKFLASTKCFGDLYQSRMRKIVCEIRNILKMSDLLWY